MIEMLNSTLTVAEDKEVNMATNKLRHFIAACRKRTHWMARAGRSPIKNRYCSAIVNPSIFLIRSFS